MENDMRTCNFLLMALLALAFPASGQSLEELETKESFDHIGELLDRAELALNTASRIRQLDCVKATGSAALCKCLNSRLPVRWSFAEYVAIVTRTKEENGYAHLDPKIRPAYDIVSVVRDECVAASLAP
jgi:hypothetical protein